MDFLQATYELHRRYLTGVVAEEIEDALSAWGPDEVFLRVFLHPEVLEAILSMQSRGVWWDDYLRSPVPNRPMDLCTNARNRRYVVPDGDPYLDDPHGYARTLIRR